MNSRDINEIRRRLTPDNNNLTCSRIIICTQVEVFCQYATIANTQICVSTPLTAQEGRSEQTKTRLQSKQVEVCRRIEWSCILEVCNIPSEDFQSLNSLRST